MGVLRGRAVAAVGRSDPLVSFVVPVLNEADNIAATLGSHRRHFPACELLVVDGGSVSARGGAFNDSLAKCEISMSKSHDGSPDDITGFRVVRNVQ